MKDILIKRYINNITHKNIYDFAKVNNIILTENEVEYIYSIIKNNYQELLYGNPDKIFRELKINVSHNNYEKIINLFYLYKSKYQHFL